MPLTPFQGEVLRLIAAHRSPASHVAGGIALNSSPESPRISKDIDIFHDGTAPLIAASEKDIATLSAAGFEVRRVLWEIGFRRVHISRGSENVILEWAYIDAWRYFPIEEDAVLGWRLHLLDALTNKTLALASRSETRDLIDLVNYAQDYPLERVIWAACGKHSGWNPHSMLARMRRNAVVRGEQLAVLAARFTPQELNDRWLEIADAAEVKIDEATQGDADPGFAYITPEGKVSWWDDPTARPLAPQMGSVWPRIVE